MNVTKPKVYRDVIDELVYVCRKGQGQIGARRAQAGIWNANATPTYIPEQHEINLFLTRLSAADRGVLAQLLAHEVEVGVFESLKALEKFGVTPFEDGYEGSPSDDFIGRLSDWRWPEP